MWWTQLHRFVMEQFEEGSRHNIFGEIIGFLTGCHIVECADVTVLCGLRLWDCDSEVGEIFECLLKNNNQHVVCKHRCAYNRLAPVDQIDIEFELLIRFFDTNMNNVVLPIAVCFGEDNRCIEFLVFEKWHPKNLAYHLYHSPTREIQDPEASFLFAQIVRGVQALHNVGIVHCDLVCENILVDDATLTRVAVADLGVALSIDDPHILQFSSMGHADCKAPEKIISFKYDIYGLGKIGKALYFKRSILSIKTELLTKLQDLRKQMSYDQLMHATNDETLLENICNIPPKRIRDMLDRCVSPNPEERPTCQEILIILDSM